MSLCRLDTTITRSVCKTSNIVSSNSFFSASFVFDFLGEYFDSLEYYPSFDLTSLLLMGTLR